MSVLSMVINCPSYTHRILNVSPGFIFGGRLIFERKFEGAYIRKGLYLEFYDILATIVAS